MGGLVVFLRGVNVGGSRSMRPSALAKELAAYDVVNIGAAGTFVVRGAVERFLEDLREKLPFATVVAACDGAKLVRLAVRGPFDLEPVSADLVPFVGVLSGPSRKRGPRLPMYLPDESDWHVKILGASGPLVHGVYRRRMKTIGYLGRIDEIFGVPATIRSWSTILKAIRILENGMIGGQK